MSFAERRLLRRGDIATGAAGAVGGGASPALIVVMGIS
jgi:hypothetical protein